MELQNLKFQNVAKITALKTSRVRLKNEKVGDVLIMKIKNKSNSLFVGTAYDPQHKLTLKFQLNVSGDKMTTKGCIAGGLLCTSVGWTRI